MENNTEALTEQSSDGLYELGQWMGRKQAFSLVSGKTAAADVECLRNIREKKLYRANLVGILQAVRRFYPRVFRPANPAARGFRTKLL
jgi:hypothetical protein